MPTPERGAPAQRLVAEQVVAHLRRLIERGKLRPGYRLPPERGLAKQIGVSRSSVRAGLRSLTAMRVLETRHGAGTFVTAGPPTLGTEPLRFLAALHGFSADDMFEARRTLEEEAEDDPRPALAQQGEGLGQPLIAFTCVLFQPARHGASVAPSADYCRNLQKVSWRW